MKISWNHLQGWFAEPLDKQFVLERLTMTGLEVEEDRPLAADFSGVVVAEVVSCERHPDADKLSLCKVNAGGDELLQIICGAPNVKAGLKVPCAKVGAILPGNFKIAERKMRGLVSYGMLCSGDELGCPDGVDGLLVLAADAPIGMDIRDYLDLNDSVVEFKITPNRGDCLSYLGLAREVAALTGASLKAWSAPVDRLTKVADSLTLQVTASQECPHYVGLVIDQITNQQASPAWLVRVLERSGVRAISPVVDITNYVMLMLGQPMHAFDYAQLAGGLHVRMANAGEQLTLLDNTSATLQAGTLVIANGTNQAVAIAGVMGGLDSGVTSQTGKIVLESASFSRAVIQGKAKLYGVSSDSAFRFERGVDSEIQHDAINLAAALIVEICGGQVGEYVHFSAPEAKPTAAPIELSFAEIDAFVGQSIEPSRINQILTALGCQLVADARGIKVSVPSYRFDLVIKADIIEEIVRVYGYDKIEAVMPKLTHTLNSVDSRNLQLANFKNLLQAFGFNEIISYAFIEDKYSQLFADCQHTVVKLQNPIAGLNCLRNNLVAGLVKSLQYNVNRGQERVWLFELARVFHSEAACEQPLFLTALVYGSAEPINWANSQREVDFYDLRLVVEQLLAGHGQLKLVASQGQAYCHPGRSAEIILNGVKLGYIAQLHPKFSQELGLAKLPYLFELNLDLIGAVVEPKLKELSKYQKVSRDLAFVVNSQVAAGDLLATIAELSVADLHEVQIFDVFSGGNLAANEKSIALNLLFQGGKTLTDEEINVSLDLIKQQVTSRFAARLR